MIKIKMLEQALESKVKRIAPGAFYREYLSRDRGDKTIMGPHVTVYVPAAMYKPTMRRDLFVLFNRVHSNLLKVKLEPLTRFGGSGGPLYRQVVLIQRAS